MKRSSPTEAAAEVRDELLALGWPTSNEVGQVNGSHAADLATWARAKRDAGELLGVWSASDLTYRHPSFQFYPDGTLRPQVQELLVALAEIPEFAPHADPSGWRRTFWLYGSKYALVGSDGEPRAAADVFVEAPDAVIQLAHEEAGFEPSW